MRATEVLVAAALLCSACQRPMGELAQVEVGLGATVPANVASISVFVIRDRSVVASATVAPTQRFISFGVPAEVPLDFRIVARTDLPGPPGIDRMPAFVGSLVRSIPLRSETTSVAITAHPAGVLTVLDRVLPEDERPSDPVHVILESDGARSYSPELDLRGEGGSYAFVVRAGGYHATTDPLVALLDATGAIFVGAEQETLVPLGLLPPPSPVLPEDPIGLEVALEPGPAVEEPGLVRLRGAPPEALRLAITATSAEGSAVIDPNVELAVRVITVPEDAVALLDLDPILGLPASVRLEARAAGRAIVAVDTLLPSGRRLRSSFPFVVLEPGVVPGPPAQVVLRLRDPFELRTGTELWIEILDQAGRRSEGVTTLDFSGSDPWVDLGTGPAAILRRENKGFLSRRIAAPSGPRGLARALRLVATSTDGVVFSGTSSISLPAVDAE